MNVNIIQIRFRIFLQAQMTKYLANLCKATISLWNKLSETHGLEEIRILKNAIQLHKGQYILNTQFQEWGKELMLFYLLDQLFLFSSSKWAKRNSLLMR